MSTLRSHIHDGSSGEAAPRKLASGDEPMSFSLDDLKKSKAAVGQIYPVLLDKHGKIIDGYHRKRVDPNWKEERLNVEDPLEILKIRVNAQYRREVPFEEKAQWVKDCRKLLREKGLKGTQEDVAEALGLSRQWVTKYDEEPVQPNKPHEVPRRGTLPVDSNVWGLEEGKVVQGDPKQPDAQFYHGSTPAFVIENLLEQYKPKKVLDSMAGMGTMKYVCDKRKDIVEKVDQFDVYPWEKGGVLKGDAENPPTNDIYDLIFNHIPYLNMVRYGNDEVDLSTLNLSEFLDKTRKIFHKNHALLKTGGNYAVLVGDWRQGSKIIPLTAHITLLGLECGFILFDEAVKLSSEQKGKRLQEYRAEKGGYLPQNYDTVLVFRRQD
jgi:hypothetical protein